MPERLRKLLAMDRAGLGIKGGRAVLDVTNCARHACTISSNSQQQGSPSQPRRSQDISELISELSCLKHVVLPGIVAVVAFAGGLNSLATAHLSHYFVQSAAARSVRTTSACACMCSDTLKSEQPSTH